ncbi:MULTISPECIES: hypothetical protein [Pseudomonas]|jgi:hypothetical protein|uniref:hypothetical protein n=1 Tax=Pseudomonas TaxID=286 RepID=UPI001C81AE8A|nr:MULTISPECIES: hypothetical protein [Pseudomonas]MDG9928066.1 hypothetical protein [Pseudomonas sp. GD04042]MDH0482075.1 hypothetical protein [Pseudomonas sp. GD04015]MDH0604030.1 hypothetical protein [Pseudomonas sp. GD03869]MDH0896307.1 hypothetical protein [Pseudomonas sp. GD03875]MDH1067762.1 hypothetical protein [Pseudomonas sp. GD03985]
MNLHCVHRNYQIKAAVVEHPGIPTPWAGGCLITTPTGETLRRMPLPLQLGFLGDLDKAQHASIAHGKWLVDQHLDQGRELH